MRIRAPIMFISIMCTAIDLGSCVSLEAPVPPTPAARKITGATVAAALPAGWTSTPTNTASAAMPPTAPPPPTSTATPRPTSTPGPILTPTETFAVEGASTDEIVTEAFQAYLRKDERTLLRLYTKEAADLCTLSFGSITHCIGIPYDAHGLDGLEEWYLRPDAPADRDSTLEVETVITKWSNDDSLWMHAFLLEKVDGNWLISYPQTKIDVYEE